MKGPIGDVCTPPLFLEGISVNIHMDNQTRRDTPPGGRFDNRAKRIARRTERDNFSRIIMPAFYIFGALGWTVFLLSFIYSELTDADASGFFAIAAGPTLLVGLMEAYRFVRGHHSEALDEP